MLLNVSCGVTQGSILGPKLMIMYINDICKVSQVLKYILFADDTNLLCCDRDVNERVPINGGLEQLQTWFYVNRLCLNMSKTNYIIFGNRRITAYICVRINKQKINRVYYTQLLGVVIDDKLNWKSHILSIRFKLLKCCAILYIEPVPCLTNVVSIFCTILFSCLILCIALKYQVKYVLQIFIVSFYFRTGLYD